MIRALFSAGSGMSAQQMNVDNIANNLANANTTGFKMRRTEFQDLLYQNYIAPGTASTAQTTIPRVCLDLDGVLAHYSGWEGLDQIGPPIPGALDFARELAEIADIVIFTSRCSLDAGGEAPATRLSPRQLRIKIIEWLEKYKFPYADVYAGQGKPRASAFIDDRAVYCSPQKDKAAFKNALQATKAVLSRSRKDVRAEELA